MKNIITTIGITFFIYLAWQQVPVECHTDLNSTADVVLLNLNKCVENCWKKHGFGNDLDVDDCYLIDVFIQDKELKKDDFTKLDYIKVDFDSLEPLFKHKVKIRYSGNERIISLILIS